MELNRYNKGGREWMMVMDMDKVTFLDGFRTFLHKFNGTGISDVVITTGVSNFPHIGWSATSMTNSDTQVESFCNILQDSFLMQMNRLVARPSSTTDNRSTGRILDLILTNHQALITNVPTRSGSYYSAHISVTFTIKSSFRRVNYGARKVYNY